LLTFADWAASSLATRRPANAVGNITLKLLEAQLTAHGFRVFVDRHVQISVEWAAEIERQVRASYAVVPLLSETSVRSEMLEYEVETAHKAAQSQDGRPRILPVRVGYSGPLPEQSALPAILDPLHYTLWQSPQDDARLVAGVVHALRNPPQPKPERVRLEPAGGVVPLDAGGAVPHYRELLPPAQFRRSCR
jgi:hypothetical protein